MACQNLFVLRKVEKHSQGMSFEHVRVHMIRYPKSELLQFWLGKLPQTLKWYFVLCARDSNCSRICCTSGRHLNEKQINRANKSISCACVFALLCVPNWFPICMANLWTNAPAFIKRLYSLANEHCIFDIRLYFELTVNEPNLGLEKDTQNKCHCIFDSFHAVPSPKYASPENMPSHTFWAKEKRDILVMSFCVQSNTIYREFENGRFTELHDSSYIT